MNKENIQSIKAVLGCVFLAGWAYIMGYTQDTGLIIAINVWVGYCILKSINKKLEEMNK